MKTNSSTLTKLAGLTVLVTTLVLSACSKTHDEAAVTTTTTSASVADASDTWNSMEDGFGEHLERLNVAMEIRSTETIKQAVIAGMGVAFLSAHTISQELKAGSLVVLDVAGFPVMLNWYVVHRKSKRLPPVAQAFKDFLLADGAALIAQYLALTEVKKAPAWLRELRF